MSLNPYGPQWFIIPCKILLEDALNVKIRVLTLAERLTRAFFMSLFISASVIPSVLLLLYSLYPLQFLRISSQQLLKNSMLLLSFVSHEFIWYDAVVEPLLSSSVKIQHFKSFFNLQPLIVPNYCNWYLLKVQTVYKLLPWRSLVCIIFKKHLLYGSTPTEKSKSSRKLSRHYQSSQVFALRKKILTHKNFILHVMSAVVSFNLTVGSDK